MICTTLPDDILLMRIFTILLENDVSTLKNCACVSKRWNELARVSLWGRLLSFDTPDSIKLIVDIVETRPDIRFYYFSFSVFLAATDAALYITSTENQPFLAFLHKIGPLKFLQISTVDCFIITGRFLMDLFWQGDWQR